MNSGEFFIGCNYWASHAGTGMWSDWRPDIVEKDLKTLSEYGIRVLRVFPLWPDFQPISILRGGGGTPIEFSFGEKPLPDNPAGAAGVSQEAITHFEEFAKLASKYDIKLVVGLITGWMSGRLFVPPALDGLNVLTDPEAIKWEVRFVKYFVSHFKDTPSIVAWDLGNECNVMGSVPSQADAWNWISAITNAIKSEDNTRQVISGMHSLKTEGLWTIQDQAEVTDILTTHAYASPTYGSDREPVNTIRTVLHPTANTIMWEGIGGKPCFLEETGTFGLMQANQSITADYARNNFFTLWAHNCKGMMWWCGFEQSHLEGAPYDWNAVERNLGLFLTDYSPKPVASQFYEISKFLDRFPNHRLPERIIDGVCILTKDANSWFTAYSTFVLSKQAGLDIEYQYCTQAIKDSKLYFLPSVSSKWGTSISRRRLYELLDKVKNGATLYISLGADFISPFNEFTGLEVLTREKNTIRDLVTIKNFADVEENIKLHMAPSYKLNLETVNAKVIGSDQNGNPAFTVADYGKGKVYFLNYPMEKSLFYETGVFNKKDAEPYWMIYKYIKEGLPSEKMAVGTNPMVGLTEHIVDENSRILVAINYEPVASKMTCTLAEGWQVSESIYGELPKEIDKSGEIIANISKNDAIVFSIKRKK